MIDLNNNGFALTNLADGVNFDFNNDGVKERISWTARLSDDAFLVLDRNNNGVIDGGNELFGSSSPQPLVDNANGFLALAEFDKPANGGNSNGKIDASDWVFSKLRLWQDLNHDGLSNPQELLLLSDQGIATISLAYTELDTMDVYGNWFRYRSKVTSNNSSVPTRWIWDVFLLRELPH